MIIGITGKSGSGKSTIANIIGEEFDFVVIDVDKVAHKVLTFDAYKYFLEKFGITAPGNVVDRKFLGKYLFNNNEMMEAYNAFIYELIKIELNNLMQDKTKNYCLDWNFLPITNLFLECDLKILMKCDVFERRKRVKLRDNIDDAYFDARESKCLEYNEDDYDLVLINTNLHEKKDEVKKVLGDVLWK